MSIIIKTENEIEKMRIAGKLAAEVLEIIEPYVVPGVTTDELNQICHDYIIDVQQAIPAPLNYRDFPKSICTSINQQICHGIPSGKNLNRATSSILTLPSLKTTTMVTPVKCFASAK
jgi:Methionine aminopeptidase